MSNDSKNVWLRADIEDDFFSLFGCLTIRQQFITERKPEV
jgi:hypothetical protein